MAYPKPENPHYCPGSNGPAWRMPGDVTCPACGRHVAVMVNGVLYPHLDYVPRASAASEHVRSIEATVEAAQADEDAEYRRLRDEEG